MTYVLVQFTGWIILSHAQLCLTSLTMPTIIAHVCTVQQNPHTLFLLLGFETGSQVSEAGLELLILLPLPPDTGVIGL